MQTFHYVRLNPPNQTSAVAVSTEENNKTRLHASLKSRHERSVAYTHNFWENASTLTISFIHDVPVEWRDRIERVIRRWEPFVSLAFEVVEDGKGKIRIAVGGTDSYSTMGTEALTVDTGYPTMMIGVKPDAPEFDRTLLHEFGHALGFHHAHLHPEANIAWNKPVVYDFFKTNFGWSKAQVNHNFFDLDPSYLSSFGKYDKDSIMHYPIPSFMTLSNWQSGINSVLSEGDKLFARQIYPPINYRELPL